MRELLEDLRGSPDIVAVLVLCLLLGVASHPLPSGWAEPLSEMKLHWNCADPAQTAVEAVEEALSHLGF